MNKGSRLVYGTGNPVFFSNDQAKAFEVLDNAYKAGFRTFDTAYSYRNAEAFLGDWLQSRHLRDEIVIIDKGCDPKPDGKGDIFSGDTIRNQLEVSLHRLHTDHVEFYLLHRDDPTKPVDEIIDVLNELKKQGKIQQFGVSNWTKERIIEANLHAKKHNLEGFTAFSPSFSLVELVNDLFGGSVTISRDENKAFRNWLSDSQYPVFNYSSLGRGYCSGRFNPFDEKPIEECLHKLPIQEYDSSKNRERLKHAFILAEKKGCTVSQICLAYVLHQKMNMYPLVAPTSYEHMVANMDALNIQLTQEELNYLECE